MLLKIYWLIYFAVTKEGVNMEYKLNRAWDLDNIAHNAREIRRITDKKTEIMGVVKADAYGHMLFQFAFSYYIFEKCFRSAPDRFTQYAIVRRRFLCWTSSQAYNCNDLRAIG